MNIIEDKDNKILNRKEVKLIVEAGKNPSMEEAIEKVAIQFKSEKENIVIKQIKGKFGRDTFLISAFIYRSKEDKEKTEPKKKQGEQAEEAKKEEAK